eukprot:4577398-Prymnesium_polylepis.1
MSATLAIEPKTQWAGRSGKCYWCGLGFDPEWRTCVMGGGRPIVRKRPCETLFRLVEISCALYSVVVRVEK